MQSQIFKRTVLVILFLAAGCAKHVPKTVLPAPDRVVELRTQLTSLFANPDFNNAFWGVAVQSIDNGQILYEQNARKLLMPASNMKIVTAVATLKTLGPDFTYETKMFAENPVENGKIAGDVVVTSNGDPTISAEELQGWAMQLKQNGLQEIDGNIIGDDSAFEQERLGFGWSWDDLPYYYATETSALQFAENAITINLFAGNDGTITVEKIPETSYVQVNQTVNVQADAQPSIQWMYNPESRTVYASGTLPPGGKDYGSFSIHDPAAYFVEYLKEALETNGIAVRGIAQGGHRDTSSWAILIDQKSAPLKEMLPVLLKRSQNLYAETFLKTLGNGKTADGIQAVQSALLNLGVPQNSLVVKDGSGLSRYNYVTPFALVTCLAKIYRDDPSGVFYNALPVAGVDGTLKSRMKQTAAENNVHAKTGSIENVRTLSGYVHTKDGEMLVFSFLANNYSVSADSANAIEDQAAELLANFSRK